MTISSSDGNFDTEHFRDRAVACLVAAYICTNVIVLIGWCTQLDWLKNPFPQQPPVAPSTALCLITAGISVLTVKRGKKAASCVLSAAVLFVSLLICLRYLHVPVWDFDQFLSLAPLPVTDTFAPGRMAPNTALCLLFSAAAILLVARSGFRSRSGNYLSLATLLVATVTGVGYLYNQRVLLGIGIHTPMAFPTVCSIVCESLSIMFLQPALGIAPFVFGSRSGDKMARKMLPLALVVPVLLGYLRLAGVRAGWFDDSIGFTAVICSMAFLFAALILRNSRLVNSLEEHFDESRRTMHTFYDELNTAREEALEAAKSKSSFLANMSHEIRTPMNAVIGCSDMLKRTALGAEQQRLVDIILSSGSTLVDIINDILVFSKLEAGKFELNCDEIRIVQLVETTADLLADKAGSKSLSLTTYVAESANRVVLGDAQRVRQILLNLLSNAVKFTEQGSIHVQVEADRIVDQQIWLRFNVQDTGVGISAENLGKLFHPFVQCDNSITRKYGGTGLGLAISRRLAELMGGSLDVTSSPESGSTFSLLVKFSLAPDGKELSIPPELSGRRMLVVATLHSEYDVIRNYGRLWRMEVDYAPDWLSALHNIEMSMSARSMRRYAVVIMNHHLTGTNVQSFVEMVLVRDPQIKNIVLSPMTGLADKFELSLKGVGAMLSKPLHQSGLFDCLRQVLALTNDSAESLPQVPVTLNDFSQALPSSSCKDVLVVEDNPVNQEVARLQLEELGFAPYVVSNGAEALSALNERRFGLILMDCQMPVMDGFETTRRIRQTESSARMRIPIVAMTANAMEGDREACLAAGMDDYVTKPLTSERLKDATERWMLVAFLGEDDNEGTSILPSMSPKLDNGQPGGVAPASHVLAAGANDMQSLLAELHAIYGIDASRNLLEMFATHTPVLLRQLDEAIDTKQFSQTKTVAHELKGSCSALRIDDMHQLSRHIELLARKGSQHAEMVDASKLLQSKFEHWRRLIELMKLNEFSSNSDHSPAIKIFLVEDNELTRTGLRALLSQTPRFTVVGEAVDGTAALESIGAQSPDLVLIDIGLPDISGIEVTRRIKGRWPNMKALMFTSHDDEHDMFESFSAGADGYVVKHDFDRARLELAINSVSEGNCWLDPSIARRILHFARHSKDIPAAVVPAAMPDSGPPQLTEEEVTVLNGVEECNGVCAASPGFLQRLHRFVDQ
jgi:signal transduction histidine kinase/CheY-like chemotaxis protein